MHGLEARVTGEQNGELLSAAVECCGLVAARLRESITLGEFDVDVL